MCGIAGRANLRSRAPADARVLRAMCDLIAHRGPDDQGVLVDGPVGFGHRRDAIIDLSEGGHQPMSGDGGRVWLTLNGEIYNFQQLRGVLQQRGHRFRSDSDTEVLLAAYLEYGVGCLAHLRGMFAFAIWDARDDSLFVARDRAGKKPLFYRMDADGLAFASEPKAFLAEPGFVPQPDYAAISHYLSYQYVPGPFSAFAGVSRLPPGHYMIYRGAEPEVHRYWRLSFAKKQDLTESEAAEELVRLLREATRLRMHSDVPLGAFLSGGIDSGVIVAMMAEQSTAPVKAFSIGYDEQDFDELRYARVVADRYGTEHHEFVVRPEATEILPDVVWHYNEPFADPSALPTFHLSRLTRRHVKVALNGDGGDENFAGYRRYLPRPRDAAWRRLPEPVRRFAAGVAALVPDGPGHSAAARSREWLRQRAGSPEAHHIERMMQIRPPLKRRLCTPEFLRLAGADSRELLARAFRDSDGSSFLERALDVDVRTYLPDALLVKVDVASMSVALECRSPFLDHLVMEFAASLPVDFKLKAGASKYLLKQAARRLLPPEIVDRPKRGFGVPLVHWFRHELAGMAREVLLSSRARARGLFRMDVVAGMIEEHVQRRCHWHDQLWNLLMLELWFERFIDGSGRSETARASDA